MTNGTHLGSGWSENATTRALAVVGAAILGGVLGGFVFRRAGRLAFVAAAAFVARDVWFGEGRSGLERLLRNQGIDARPAR